MPRRWLACLSRLSLDRPITNPLRVPQPDHQDAKYIHDRMPVILDPDAYDLWLDPSMTSVVAASEC